MTHRLIGVVHLQALPGAPRFAGDMQQIIDAAVADAVAYQRGGASAVVIENFGDVPFTRTSVPAATVASMAAAGRAVREAVALPIGFNVLRNDAISALSLCAACGGSFVRVNVLSGAAVTDQGIIQGDAYEVLRLRDTLCPKVQILADVHVKHAAPLAPTSLGQTARDTLERGLADALIISGPGTGSGIEMSDLRETRNACPEATLYVGSGANMDTATELLRFADGLIVGSSLKQEGILSAPVDIDRVRAMSAAIGL